MCDHRGKPWPEPLGAASSSLIDEPPFGAPPFGGPGGNMGIGGGWVVGGPSPHHGVRNGYRKEGIKLVRVFFLFIFHL